MNLTRPALLAVLLTGCATLPLAPIHPFVPPPPATTPIEVCWLETAGTEGWGGFAAAGHARTETWEATASVLLVRHPKGDVLIDTGSAQHPEEELAELGGYGRWLFRETAGRMVLRGDLIELLAAAGVEKPTAVILSHSHADHAGGVTQLPGVKVWVGPPEQAFIELGVRKESSVVMPAQARALAAQLEPIPFARAPYETFDESFDVFGDGAVVVVPTYGHTPGSVSTFIAIDQRRLLHVGDLVSSQESLERNVPKSFPMRMLTDEDRGAVGEQVAKLVQLHGLDPALTILPAHDRPAFEAVFGSMPKAHGGPRCVRSAAPLAAAAATRAR